MDVQNILYVLAFIIFFVIRTYNNYKKDEAKRQQVERERSRESYEQPLPEPPVKHKSPFEELFGEFLDIPEPQKPYYEEVSDGPPAEKRYIETSYTEPPYKTLSPGPLYREPVLAEEVPEEVSKLRAQKKLEKKKSLAKVELEMIDTEENSSHSINLQEAIIHQVILERPNY